MKYLFLILITITFNSCSSSKVRTKYTDKTMRIMIDPESLAVKDYVRVQAALVSSGKWAVIDRSKAFTAIQKEQERIHRNNSDRFDNKEKWSHWGKMYGVGGVVVGHIQCARKINYFNKLINVCNQFLNLVDSNTGEVIVAVEDQIDIAVDLTPPWENIVDKLNENYPENYIQVNYSETIHQYRDESNEESIRQINNAN